MIASPGRRLSQAQERFDGVVVGGINDQTTIAEGTPQEVAAQAQDAIEQTGGRRLVVGPGCVIPTNTPDANVRAVIDTVTRDGTALAATQSASWKELHLPGSYERRTVS